MESFDLLSWLRAKPLEDGILEIYKPYGLPSNAVVELVKKAFGLKVGHGGTLDPLAEGKLILGIGKGTKKLQNYLGGNKVYKATFIYGITSISGDLEQIAEVLPTLNSVSKKEFKDVIDQLKQPYTQKIPVFSAVKVKGKRMYDLAREGKLDIPRKEITTQLLEVSGIDSQELTSKDLVNRLELLKKKIDKVQEDLVSASESVGNTLYRKYSHLFDEWKDMFSGTIKNIIASSSGSFIELSLTIEVPKGTYIRSLVEDIGNELGLKGTLIYLGRKTTIK